MNRKAKATFEAPNMVLEEVRVFVEINRFQRKFSQTLSPVGIGSGRRSDTSTAKFRAGAILKVSACVFATSVEE
jgi:hypothetical protein